MRYTKEQREKIREKVLLQEYEDVFIVYGFDAFNRFVPKKAKKELLKKYVKEQKTEKIQAMFNKKYAKGALKKIADIQKRDATSNKLLGWLKYCVNRIIHTKLKFVIVFIIICPSIFWWLVTAFLQVSMQNSKAADAQREKEQLQEYEDKAELYALALHNEYEEASDIEVICTMVDDMWKYIAYGSPETQNNAQLGLTITNRGAKGVCRHMASDMVLKLNKYNPEYNARLFYVDMGHSGEADWMNIERTIDTEGMANVSQSQQSYNNSWFLKKIAANHVIVALDLPGRNQTILVDNTNPSIGVLDHGKVVMFNAEYDSNGNKIDNPMTWTYKKRADSWLQPDTHFFNTMAVIKSYFTTKDKIEALREEFNVIKQNETLDRHRKNESYTADFTFYYDFTFDEVDQFIEDKNSRNSKE